VPNRFLVKRGNIPYHEGNGFKGAYGMLLGEKLKETRQNKGLSQSTVAEHLNISRQSISKWENNSSYPDLDNLVRLSEYYEISIDDLLKENQGLKTKIAENNFKIKDSQQKLDHIRSGYERDEGLALLIISLIGCLVTPLGILIAPIVLKRNKATNTFHRGVIVTSIVCMLINFWGVYGFLSTMFGWGVTTTVEYLG
jgi:transcriptional regulator with XRE-family HTH domain